MKLIVYNRQKVTEISRTTQKLIEKAVKLCVKKEKLSFDCEASITLVDNDTIQNLNKDHRDIDNPTDVLSFPLIEYVNGTPQIGPGDIAPGTDRVLLGDIIISAEKAIEQAQSYGHSSEREFAFLAVHGILHLLGYDHETKEDEKLMFSIQDEILSEMGLVRG